MMITSDWNFSLSTDDILRGQGADPQIVRSSKPKLMVAAQRALAEGIVLIRPIALTREVSISGFRHERILLETGTALTGSLVTQQLGGAQRVVVAVCTIGSDLENAVTYLLGQDPTYALALDGLGNAAMENLAQQVCGRIEARAQSEGWSATTPLSPGNPEWPVDVGHQEIFSLLDPSEAGVMFTSGGMMVPKKSISFIVGIGTDVSQVGTCNVCSLKETCRYRHD
jgi:hypothetical protein